MRSNSFAATSSSVSVVGKPASSLTKSERVVRFHASQASGLAYFSTNWRFGRNEEIVERHRGDLGPKPISADHNSRRRFRLKFTGSSPNATR
jgi:hypothetical protein